MKQRTKLILFCTPGILVILALIILDLYVHNFHTVIPNEVYRSQQLSGAQFTHVIKDYHIKSILNLRGNNQGQAWYAAEINASKKADVKHYNIALKSKVMPTPKQMNRLVHILNTAPKPLLLHCESGVDRSGLASMISLILADVPLKTAEQEVSMRYFVLSDQSVGLQFLRRYKAFLAKHKLQSNKHSLDEWLKIYGH